MASNYLDKNGLLYVWQKIKTTFATKTELGTTNSNLDALEDRVDAIDSAHGEPNQNAFSNVKVGSATIAADSETDTLTLTAGTNITLSADSTNDGVTINATSQTDNNYTTADKNKLAGITAGANVVDSNYVHTDNNYTTTEKNKLSGVASGAQVNVIESVKVNGTAQTVSSKSVNITVPTKVSDITNDSGFQTASDVNSAIATAVGGITGVDYQIVQSLPASGTKGVIYLISNSGSNPNSYDEYIYVNNKFEKIGTTDIDLTNYWNTTSLTTITNAEIDTIVAS